MAVETVKFPFDVRQMVIVLAVQDPSRDELNKGELQLPVD
jgi:hypothetical protein